MKKLCLLLWCCCCMAAYAQQSPATLYPGLFEAVQMARVYPDGKTFPDAIPKESPAEIMRLYNKEKKQPGFDIAAFTHRHFSQPVSVTAVYHSNTARGILHHIDTLWQVLRRDPAPSTSPSLIPLPYPYIVPGGRFREIYYWDSYFTMLGLMESGRQDMVQLMTDNFAWLIHRYGFIPNGNRTYFLTRSQPPFFAMMVELLAQHGGDSMYRRYRPALLREYAFWMKGAKGLTPGKATLHVVKLKDGTVLNRYWDNSNQPREESWREDVLAAKSSSQPAAACYRNIRAAAASGWDFSSRWLTDPQQLGTIQTTRIIPVDLNGLLYRLETVLEKTYRLESRTDSAVVFARLAARRKAAVLRYCWNDSTGYFMDYNWTTQQQSPALTLAGTTPLFFGIASPEQAARVADVLRRYFLQPGGLRTTLIETGQQWDAPNAWAPLQWMAIAGLSATGQQGLSDTIAHRWIRLNISVFKATGKLMEKYHVSDTTAAAGGGEYPLQDGFGWTNGVLRRLLSHYTFTEN